MNCSPLGENTEVCCLIPNVSTNTINVFYYIKIIADPDDLLAKKIELKMMVDFYSKEERINRSIYDNFNNQIKKINSGDQDINYMEPYLQHQKNDNIAKRMSLNVINYQHTLNTNNEFGSFNNQIQNQNYENNNYNSIQNPNNYGPAPNYLINNQNMDNQINNNYQNYQNIYNNNYNNNQNTVQFPEPPKENLEEESDLPSLEEIEEQHKNNKEKEEKANINNAYPSF